jgi:hypothetical protein
MVKCIDEIMELAGVKVLALLTGRMLANRKFAILGEQRIEHNHAPCGTFGVIADLPRRVEVPVGIVPGLCGHKEVIPGQKSSSGKSAAVLGILFL